MSDAALEIEAPANHEWLLDEFVRQLLRHEPDSVLDVGCGAGLLLRILRGVEVEAVGLDQPGTRLEALREDGFQVREGTAYDLPFGDDSVDWITMRHIPHHLADPARAVAEALRVARSGLLLAEPCFDASVSSQRGAIALDHWEKRQHRRSGMYHAEVLDLGALLALLPGGLETEVHQALRLRRRSIADFEREAAELVAELAVEHPEREELTRLLGELERLGLSWNGSLCVAVRCG